MLHDASLIKDEHVVAPLQRGEAMRDHDARSIHEKGVDGGLDLALRHGIEP